MGYGRNKTLAHPCDLPYKARTFVARVESDQSVPVRIQGPYINESTKEIIAPISIQNTFTHTHTLPMGKSSYSFMVPMLAKYREHALKATSRTPKVCSDMAAAGISLGTSLDIEKTKILGLYPVYREF